MKIIDLLNKIANGEKPTIKDGINKYEYNEIENDYITGMGYDYEHYFSSISNILEYLNDEIEIIEDTPKEDKKIEKIIWNKKSQHNIVTDNTKKTLEQLLSRSEQLKKSINEIIDRMNGE